LATRDEYEYLLANRTGLTKMWTKYQTDQLRRHYGLMRHRATTICKEQLLGPEGISQESYTERISGLDVWIKLLKESHLEWGEFLYLKK
jgi:hypothetical protein